MWLRLVASLAFCAAMFLANGGTASATSGWVIVPGVNPSNNSTLHGVAAISPTDAWAVGDSTGSTLLQLIENWNGVTWTQVAAPNAGTSSILAAITAISPTDIWTVGNYYDANTKIGGSLTEHWNGTQWSIIPSPNLGYQGSCLVSASAVSSNDVWAVGNACSGQGVVSMHWNGTQWSIIPLAIPPGAISGVLNGVATVGPHDVWVVGLWEDINNFYGLSEHWNGTAWKYVPTADNLYAVPLNAITHLAGPRMLAIASYGQYAEQWNGSAWTLLPSPMLPSGSRLEALTASPAAGIWSVGSANQYVQTLTLHDSTVVPSPNSPLPYNYLYSISIVPGTQDVWTVGYSSDNVSVGNVLIEYYSP